MDDFGLIDRVYDAAADPAQWRALAPAIARAFSSDSAQISLAPPRGTVQRLSCTANYTPALDAQYQAHFHRLDRYIAGARRAPPATAIVSSEHMADADFAASEHYQDYCRHLGIFYCFGQLQNLPDGSVMALGIHRDRTRPFAPTAAERARLEGLGHHLVRSHRFSRLATSRAVIEGLAKLLDQLRLPALVVDPTLRVHTLNAAAEAIITRHGGALHLHGSQLVLADPQSRARLAGRIAEIARAPDAAAALLGLRLCDGDAAHVITVEALPLPRQWNACRAGEMRILLLIHALDDCAAPRAARDALAVALRDLFGLTPTESRLACEFGVGRTVAETAAANRIAPNTARHHLKQIFSKLDCHRQSDIVRIVQRFSLGPK